MQQKADLLQIINWDLQYEVKDILEHITEKEYIELVSNVNKISERIQMGYYTKMALDQAEEYILDRMNDHNPK